MSKNAQYVDMEANVTVSLSAEILGKRNTPDISTIENDGNNQSELLWNLIRSLSGLSDHAENSGVIK